MTIHKAQGMTLDSVVVDCTSIRTPGQLGVAVGRATTLQGLQVVHYKDRCIMQHDPKVKTFYFSPPQPFLPDMSCCRFAIVDEPVLPDCDDLNTDDYNDDNDDNDAVTRLFLTTAVNQMRRQFVR